MLLAAHGCDAAFRRLVGVAPGISPVLAAVARRRMAQYREANFRWIFGVLFEGISLGTAEPEHFADWTSVKESRQPNLSWLKNSRFILIRRTQPLPTASP